MDAETREENSGCWRAYEAHNPLSKANHSVGAQLVEIVESDGAVVNGVAEVGVGHGREDGRAAALDNMAEGIGADHARAVGARLLATGLQQLHAIANCGRSSGGECGGRNWLQGCLGPPPPCAPAAVALLAAVATASMLWSSSSGHDTRCTSSSADTSASCTIFRAPASW